MSKKLPPPIKVDSDKAGQVPEGKLREWRAVAKRFKDDPREKTRYASELADFMLIRLGELAQTTQSPKVLLDCAGKLERFIAFAYKEVKE